MTPYWSLSDAGAQDGRVAIVTGANTGLGYETALALAGKGASVVLACRNQAKGEDARARINELFPQAQVQTRAIDTASLQSVRRFATSIAADFGRVDLLVNNAGVMITPHFTSEEGIEGQLAVNYLGHFLLTGLLMPTLLRTPHSRVVSLYSVAAGWNGMHFDDLQFQNKYDPYKAYSQSKMACLMFALELDRRLRAAGSDVLSIAAHPGYSKSDLSRHLPWFLRLMLAAFGSLMMQPTAEGALPTLYAALGWDLSGGEAIGPANRKQTKGPPTIVEPYAQARDKILRARLWTLSERLCDFRYELPA
ncbi:MAG TPA: oxidoreductase [Steroidobacteraceae bacterium]|jgi:NAD(P)-dependent dehydrogenase (short-subunit alcohol dehydrogenase family)|nr:oxidoreductase [Steroidobacteraceae bacterium]